MPRTRRAGVTDPTSRESGPVASAQVRLNSQLCTAAKDGIQKVLKVVGSRCAEMSLVNTSTAWHCIARLEVEGNGAAGETDPRIAKLQEHTKSLLSRYLNSPSEEDGPQPRCVSTIAWACAKLKLHDDDMMASLGHLGVHWLTSFKPFELANALWAFAKLQAKHERLFHAAREHIQEVAQRFNPRSLSMVAWAFATLRLPACQKLLRRAADAFVSGVAASREEEHPVTIANMVWALATALVDVRPEVMQDMAAIARSRLADFKAHELSIMLWAFARLGAFDPGLFAQAAEMFAGEQRLREEIHSQGISNLLWAFARQKLKQQDARSTPSRPDVLTALFPTCMRLMPRLNSVELSSMLWAVAKLAGRSGEHRAADHVLTAAADHLTQEPRLLAGMSQHSSKGLLSSYSDFFSGRKPPAPCRQLITKLMQRTTFSSAAAHSRDGGDASAASTLEANGAAPSTTSHPTTARAIMPQPVPGDAYGYSRMDYQAAAPGDLVEMNGSPAEMHGSSSGARSSFAAPCSSQPPSGSSSGSELGPREADVPATRLVSLRPSKASLKQQAPSISILPDFASCGDGLTQSAYVDVAYEVKDVDIERVRGVLVETYTFSGKQDSFVSSLAGGSSLGMRTVRLRRPAGKWFVCLTMLDSRGEAVGDPTSLTFDDKIPAHSRTLEFQHFASSASTYDPTCPDMEVTFDSIRL